MICGGAVIDDRAFADRPPHAPPVGYRSVKRAPVTPDLFRVPAAGPTGPVIGALENSLLTEHLTLDLPYRDGLRLPDPAQGVHKLAVLERHGVNGNVGRGFVKGFGALHGALASSIGHDCHNIIVVGDDDADDGAGGQPADRAAGGCGRGRRRRGAGRAARCRSQG